MEFEILPETIVITCIAALVLVFVLWFFWGDRMMKKISCDRCGTTFQTYSIKPRCPTCLARLNYDES